LPKSSQNRSSNPHNSSNSIQNEFFLHGFKSTIIILLLATLLLIAVIFTPNSMKFLNQKITQINYLGRLSNRVSRTAIATMELPIENGTSIIEEMRTDVAIEVFIKELANMRKELLTHFLDSDITNDPEFSQVVFGNACSILGPLEVLYCMVLELKNTNSSMTQLLASFETVVTQRTEDYQNSDKSAQALKKNRLLNYDLLLSSKRVLADSAIFLSNMLDEDFEGKLESLDSQRQLGLCVSIIGLVIMTLMLWVLVLNPIKEIDNNFKKILQIFPAKLILSNFSLKLFLLENPSIDANLIKNCS
jgi:NADH:ubiquinone oxidoreductase subunit 6 (subunit J)